MKLLALMLGVVALLPWGVAIVLLSERVFQLTRIVNTQQQRIRALEIRMNGHSHRPVRVVGGRSGR